jgi:hypothetical protein
VFDQQAGDELVLIAAELVWHVAAPLDPGGILGVLVAAAVRRYVQLAGVIAGGLGGRLCGDAALLRVCLEPPA